ncbi:uncharacterized protein LOC110028096 [Phalaenopsis equestris]|uniref:uncharacterized protein LOC110028096 n=1 Tax=Phalaenopsis equestris TaxID=78828 RepID=UPI0009E2A8D0|nr:uncharacterized protein LOC110028096 [Phalaenopsis equestris]
MSRLVSLHHSLSEPSLRLLRSHIMRSRGIAYLTSTDQHFLFRLVYSDLLSYLDSSASAVSRLSSRCRSRSRQNFSLTYANLKSGRMIPFAHSSPKRVNRRVKQMEKNITLVARLLEEMEILENMAKKKPSFPSELKSQKKKVARIKEESLWNKTFDEVVSLMSRAIIAIFTRICVVFGPFVNDLPPVIVNDGRLISFNPFSSKCRIYPRLTGRQHASGPMERSRSPPKDVALRNSCPIIGRGRETERKIINTVGRAGLATLYANVVLTAERLLRMRCGEEEAGGEGAMRDEIYRQLPVNMQGMVRGKLIEKWRERGLADWEMAKGWKEAVERILRWLGPVARDTVTWEEDKTLDQRRRLDVKPRVLAIQTLEFSDKEKTEAAIVEVLVGITCMCWYDGRTALGGGSAIGR